MAKNNDCDTILLWAVLESLLNERHVYVMHKVPRVPHYSYLLFFMVNFALFYLNILSIKLGENSYYEKNDYKDLNFFIKDARQIGY